MLRLYPLFLLNITGNGVCAKKEEMLAGGGETGGDLKRWTIGGL